MYEYQVREVYCFLKIKRRIGKYYVILMVSMSDEPERISPESFQILKSQLNCCVPDKGMICRVNFHRSNRPTATGGKFIGDAACTAEKVKNTQVIKVKIITQYIEKVFFCKIGSGPCLEVFTRVKPPPLTFTTYYTHSFRLNRLIK